MTETDPLTAAIERLETGRIRWAILRGNPQARGGDIDILVHPHDVGRLEDLLAPAGFVRITTWRHGHHRFYIAYNEPDDQWIKLDVVDRFAFRSGHELPQSATMAALERRRRIDGLWRLAPADEFGALLLHCLLDRRAVGPYQDVLRLLADSDRNAPLLNAIGNDEIAERALERAQLGDPEGMLALRPALEAALPRPPAARVLQQWALRAADPILKAFVRTGISVAVIGPDGSGKSTLVETLPDAFPLQVRTHYLGLYGARWRRMRETGVPGVTLLSQIAMAWPAYVAAELQRRRGRITIFDRYGYDAMLDLRPAKVGPKRALRRALLSSLAPRPDLVLVLDAPATRLHQRRQDEALAFVEQRRKAYRRLAQRIEERVRTVVIDTTVSRPAVRRRATALIWSTVAERRRRHRTWVGRVGRLRRRSPNRRQIEESVAGKHDGH